MKFLKNIFYGTIFFVLFAFVTDLLAQEFTASADKTTVKQGESFEVSFTFSGGEPNSVKDFRQPSFQGFYILSGPNQSSSIQIINGKINASITYSYVLKATSPGKFVISKASLFYKGKRFETKPLKINVLKYNAYVKKNSSAKNEDKIEKNVFLRAFVDKKNVFKDEQVILTYKLYTRLNISSPQISKLPSYQGFWTKDIDMPENIMFHYEMYKGKRFRVAEIKKIALFPRKIGKLKVEPFVLTVPVIIQKRRRSGDIFDDFFNDPFFSRRQTVERNIASNEVIINVRPLPEPIPRDFSGAVGVFDFNVSIDKQKTKVNEPITLKLILKGKGNIELTQLPEPKIPDGFEIYDPKISENIKTKGFIRGSKSAEYLIVPRVSGERKIEPISFVYFDLNKNKYVRKTFGPFNLTILRGKESYAGQAETGGFSKEEVQLLSKDIRYIKTGKINFKRINYDTGIPAWFYFSFPVISFLFIVLLFYEERKQKIYSNTDLLKQRKIEREARKRLREAKKFLDEKNLPEFYDAISFGLTAFLETKLKIPKSDFTLDKAVSVLNKKGVTEDLINRIKETYEKSEFARFAPSSLNLEDSIKLYEDTVNLIVKLNNEIGKVRK